MNYELSYIVILIHYMRQYYTQKSLRRQADNRCDPSYPTYFLLAFALSPSSEARFCCELLCVGLVQRWCHRVFPPFLSYEGRQGGSGGDRFDQPGSFKHSCLRAIDLPRKKLGRLMAFLRGPGCLRVGRSVSLRRKHVGCDTSHHFHIPT